MSTVYYAYEKLSKKYDKLLDDYANLLTKYKKLNRLYHSNSDELVSKLLNYFQCKVSNEITEYDGINYFCPHINNYCLYAGTDYCYQLCNERFR